jgi:hypothetical protein
LDIAYILSSIGERHALPDRRGLYRLILREKREDPDLAWLLR